MRVSGPRENSRTFATYALADAMKTLLPVLDSFERALQEPAREI